MGIIHRKILTLYLTTMVILIMSLSNIYLMVKIKVHLNSPSPFSITFKDVNKFDIQNLATGNLLSQVNANQLTDQLAKNILGKREHLKIRARLDALRNNTFTGGDDDVDGRRGGSGSYRHE